MQLILAHTRYQKVCVWEKRKNTTIGGDQYILNPVPFRVPLNAVTSRDTWNEKGQNENAFWGKGKENEHPDDKQQVIRIQ